MKHQAKHVNCEEFCYSELNIAALKCLIRGKIEIECFSKIYEFLEKFAREFYELE